MPRATFAMFAAVHLVVAVWWVSAGNLPLAYFSVFTAGY